MISAFAVVSLHTNGCFWKFSTEPYWFSANIIESFWYFAVPIFFMISGITLIDYSERYDTKMYFKKRFTKTFIPFLIWSFVGLLQLVVFGHVSLHELTFAYIFNGLVTTKFVEIYWFFIPLFVWYALIPVFTYIQKEKKIKVFAYALTLGFVIGELIPFVLTVFSLPIQYPFFIDVTQSVALGYGLYFLLGYIFHKQNLTAKCRYGIYVLAIFGLLMHICGTYMLSMEAGEIVKTFKNYNNVPCFIYSLGVFLFVKNNSARLLQNERIHMLIEKLAKYTFAVYLLHPFVMHLIVKVLHVQTTNIIYRVFGPFLIIGICIIIAKFVRLLPMGKRILP